jgi:hypothetical protein
MAFAVATQVYSWALSHPVWTGLLLLLVLWRISPYLAFLWRKGTLQLVEKQFVIINNCSKQVFVRLFLADALHGWRRQPTGITRLVAPGRQVVLDVPPTSWNTEVVVAWDTQRETLERAGVLAYQWRTLGVGVIPAQRTTFYLVHPTLARLPGSVSLITEIERLTTVRVAESLGERVLSNPSFAAQRPLSPHHARPANCFAGPSQEELRWMELRRPHVQAALSALLGTERTPYCNIVVLSAGGGCRAMIAGAGILDGLVREGILPSVSYLAGTSGSCWMLAQWMKQCCEKRDLAACVEGLRQSMREASAKPLFGPIKELTRLVGVQLAQKMRYKQSVTLVDVYSAVLGSRFDIPPTLSSQAEAPLLKEGLLPLPLYHLAALDVLESKVVSEEFNPYSVSYKGRCIPAYALGRPFDRSCSTDDTIPELPTSFLLGAAGSAFCTTVEKIAENFFWVGSRSAAKCREWVTGSALSLVDTTWSTVRRKVQGAAVDDRQMAIAIPIVYPSHVAAWDFDSQSDHHTPASIPFFDGGIDVNIAWDLAARRHAQVTALSPSPTTAYKPPIHREKLLHHRTLLRV